MWRASSEARVAQSPLRLFTLLLLSSFCSRLCTLLFLTPTDGYTSQTVAVDLLWERSNRCLEPNNLARARNQRYYTTVHSSVFRHQLTRRFARLLVHVLRQNWLCMSRTGCVWKLRHSRRWPSCSAEREIAQRHVGIAFGRGGSTSGVSGGVRWREPLKNGKISQYRKSTYENDVPRKAQK